MYESENRRPDRLLEVERLSVHFPLGGNSILKSSGYVRAVDGISFRVDAGETLGLVGESGCGKTTTARAILLLEQPTSGRVCFEGRDIHSFGSTDVGKYRSSVQAVLQDPWGSLNPRQRVAQIVGEPAKMLAGLSGRELADRVGKALNDVGLGRPMGEKFPHELSGGMRQRVAIARALVLSPRLIVLDEPVSALDVSLRASVMNLLRDIQDKYGIAYLLIAHDLATVRFFADHVAVMYLGQIVENGSAESVLSTPAHPYTMALLAAARRGEIDQRFILSDDLPSPTNPPSGCRFHTRCPFVHPRCRKEVPEATHVGSGHRANCHLLEDDQWVRNRSSLSVNREER